TNPRLVYCAISGFGRTGPLRDYPGYEGLVCARAGRFLSFAGQVERPGPVYGAVPVASFGAAQTALQGILAALIVAGRIGRGQTGDASLLRALTAYNLGGWLDLQLPPAGAGARGTTDYIGVYLTARTRDGRWIQFANNAPHLMHAFLKAVELD